MWMISESVNVPKRGERSFLLCVNLTSDGHACSCTSLQGNSMCITFTEASLGTSGDAVETDFGNSALSLPTLDSITHLTLQFKARPKDWIQDECITSSFGLGEDKMLREPGLPYQMFGCAPIAESMSVPSL